MADNVYYSKNCPPKMSDGRLLTDWNTRSVADIVGMAHLQTKSEHDYRKYLQQSGESIIQNIQSSIVDAHTCKCTQDSCSLNEY